MKIKHFFLASLILVFTSCEQYNSSIRDFTDGESESLNSIGIFTVSSYKQVTFSPGNLQYHPKNNIWRFAKNQYDHLSGVYNGGWIDFFGWGTGDNPTNKSTYDFDYAYGVDWGINKIENDLPDTWRTLTSDEWLYLRSYRINAEQLIGIAEVNGVNGLILLPDNWCCPDSITFKAGFDKEWSTLYSQYQAFTKEQWWKLEKAGAVFLPAAGYSHSIVVEAVQMYGNYWSATATRYSGSAMQFDFGSAGAGVSSCNRTYGRSVRLVKDL